MKRVAELTLPCCVKEFLSSQKSGYPKYLVLDERLVFLLEAIATHLAPGQPSPVGAGGRYLPGEGRQRKDGRLQQGWVISTADAVALAGVLEELARTAGLGSFIGGIGIYGPNSAHGPFVHVDTRPWRARW